MKIMWAPLAHNLLPCRHGLLPAQLFMLLATCGSIAVSSPLQKCPGDINVAGHGRVSVVAARWNVPGKRAADLHAVEGTLLPRMSSRAYFAESCQQGVYNSTGYLSLKLLGRTFKYTVDLAGVECGCNVAVYLSAMSHNREVGTCGDYYCDSNKICGVSCSEIDIQEANLHAWHTTLHTWDDGGNVGCGLGGNVVEGCSWTPTDYGVGGRCIDTEQPFNVAVSFPVNSEGLLKGIHVKLSQPGKSCNLAANIDSYKKKGVDSMPIMSKVVAAGMTPVVSYWSSTKMLWMDGTGMSKKGYCAFETPSMCNSVAKVYGFAVEDIPQSTQPSCERCPVGQCDVDPNGECRWFEGKYFKGVESYHCRVKNCDEVPRGINISSCWKWKGKSFYSINFTEFPCSTEPIPQMADTVRQYAKKLEAQPSTPTTLEESSTTKPPATTSASSSTTGYPIIAPLVSPATDPREVRHKSEGKRDVEAVVEHLMGGWGQVPGGISQGSLAPLVGILTIGAATFLTLALVLLRVKLQRRIPVNAGYTGLSTDVSPAPEPLLAVPRVPRILSGAQLRGLSVHTACDSPPPPSARCLQASPASPRQRNT